MDSGKTFRFATPRLLLAVLVSAASAAAAQDAASQDAKAPKSKRSVLLITLDTTRRDYLGFMGRTPSPSPMLDHLAQFSLVFDDAITAVPVTLPSHATLLTGLYPAHHGARNNGLYRVPGEARTLAEILHENGYATRAAVAAFVLDPIFGLDQGFDRYRAPPRTIARPDAPPKMELDAKTMIDRVLEDLEELAPPGAGAGAAAGATPFFYWLHLFDAHFPYAPPELPPMTPRQAADPLVGGKMLYEAEIRCLDRELGRLFGALQSRNIFEEMVIVVTADHGESLHDAPEGAHGFFLYDPTVRVPLMIYHPDHPAALVKTPTSLVDVTPTLLALLGIDAGAERFDGIDLGPWIADPARAPPERALFLETFFALSDFGWAPSFGCTHGPMKYIRSVHDELYDRVADPPEKLNLFTADDPRGASLSRHVDAYLESASSIEASSFGLSQADRERLRALGYAAGGTSTELPETWRELPDPLQKTDWMNRFNEAVLAQSSQDLDRAIALYRELVREEPRCATVREQLAVTLLTAVPPRADEAAKELDALLELDPRRGRCWMFRAQCDEIAAERARMAANQLRAQGKPREALKPHVEEERRLRERMEVALRRSLELEPDYPEALMLLAKALADRAEREIRRGDTAEGLEVLADAQGTIERLMKVVPPNSPEWADAATARAKVEARRTSLQPPK